MFLKKSGRLREAVDRRRVRDGLVPGRIAFGYRGTGNPCEREINPAEAAIVRRIFEEHADGKSMRDIANGLKYENIATPGLSVEMHRNQILHRKDHLEHE
jgi:DNA invertase Pin-like site-specific DNA recombinase